jgi:hypothetical protein
MVMMALLLLVILGVLALCIDSGVFAVARAQLTTEADAAALAGASKLNDPARISATFNLSGDVSAAQARAQTIGQANKVLGQAAVINANATNDPNGDIVVGYINTTTPNAPLVTAAASTSLFNSVQVKAQRTSNHGGPVPAYFSRVLGFSDVPIAIQSTATVQNYAINGFKCSPSGISTKMVPITLSVTTYNAMLAGLTTDTYTYQASSGQVLSGADGLYESSIFPVGSGAGNWGTLRVGVNNNSTAVLSSQIQNGLTTDDISNSFGCFMALNPTIQSPGNPGVSLGLKPALLSLVGKTVIVPIYDPTKITGTGSNLQYTIVNFAAVVVLNTSFNGVHSSVTVQPSLVNDPTVVPGAVQPSWSAGGVVRLHLSR